ncbi:MAG: phosphoribosylamine--glycine ligase, partial [Planctomycetes bacterium]|nr:phosphoribosylamine--glycine ligase [Planctomycetota bacterium]
AGRPCGGVLYAGLMLSEGEPSVLEFNCRFGDPETQVVLPQLRTDLANVLTACAEGRLAEQEIEWSGGAAVGVVLASGGYPGAYETGKPISGLDDVDEDVMVFHAGTALQGDGSVVTSGGRVLTVVAQAPTLAEARERAYDNVVRINFEGRMYRGDIALREL